MNNPFLNGIRKRIDAIHKGASQSLGQIAELPKSESEAIVKLLLEQSCQSQHVGYITSARKILAALPWVWLSVMIRKVIEATVDLKDEWEYRRLLELLETLKLD